jgi:hypothetical protein
MRAQRIRTGFHRIGVVLLAVCAVIAAGIVFGAIGRGTSWPEALAALIIGALLYALAYAIGWAISGFLGDGEKNSN